MADSEIDNEKKRKISALSSTSELDTSSGSPSILLKKKKKRKSKKGKKEKRVVFDTENVKQQSEGSMAEPQKVHHRNHHRRIYRRIYRDNLLK